MCPSGLTILLASFNLWRLSYIEYIEAAAYGFQLVPEIHWQEQSPAFLQSHSMAAIVCPHLLSSASALGNPQDPVVNHPQ